MNAEEIIENPYAWKLVETKEQWHHRIKKEFHRYLNDSYYDRAKHVLDKALCDPDVDNDLIAMLKMKLQLLEK